MTGLLPVLVAFQCAAGTERYEYDALGRLIHHLDSVGGSTSYVYDPAGNIREVRRLDIGQFGITQLAPAAGPVNSEVSIYGAGFSADPPQNIVRFNGAPADVLAASDTRLVVTVPAGATTGPISVAVAGSTATSAEAFTVTTATLSGFTPACAIVGATVTVFAGESLAFPPGAASASINGVPAVTTVTSGRSLKLTVPADAGTGRIKVTTPLGETLTEASLIVPPGSIFPPDTLSCSDLIGRLEIDAPPAEFLIPGPAGAQEAFLVFDGVEGAFLSLNIPAVSPAGSQLQYRVYAPRNQLIASGTVPTVHLPALPASGPYILVLRPITVATSATLALSTDVQLVRGGAEAPFGFTYDEHSHRYLFAGAQGEAARVALGFLASVPDPQADSVMTVRGPTGEVLTSKLCRPADVVCEVELSGLPSTGTYTVVVTPPFGSRSTAAIALPADANVPLVAGTPQPVSLGLGQNAALSFQGSAGQVVALELSDIQFTPASGSIRFTLRDPQGATSFITNVAGESAFFPVSLSSNGTYTLSVDPERTLSASLRATLEAGVPLLVDGDSVNVSTSVPGEGVLLTFNGAPQQRLGLGLTALQHQPPTAGSTSVTVLRPDGAVATSRACSVTATTVCDLDLPALPMAGVYSVALTAPAGSTLSAAVTLSSDLENALVLGTPLAVTTNRPGQNARLSFSGTAGQSLTLGLSDLTTTPSGQAIGLTVYRPDGAVLSTSTTAGATSLSLANLPMTGTYVLAVDSETAAAASWVASLSAGSAVFAIDGPTVPVTTTSQVRIAVLTFAGTAGQNLGLGVRGLVYSVPVNQATRVTVLTPSGSSLAVADCSPFTPGGGCDLDLPTLPTTGTFRIEIFTLIGDLSANVTLSSDATGTLFPGTPVDLVLRAGQNGRFTFDGTAGQSFGLQASGVATVPAQQTVRYSVRRPDGSLFEGDSGQGAVAIDLFALPVSGLYTVLVDPDFAADVTGQIVLDPGRPLTVGAPPVSISTTAAGEARWLTFPAQPGQYHLLRIAGLTLTPGTEEEYLRVEAFSPDGRRIASDTCRHGVGCALPVYNPAVGGTTIVTLRPSPAATLSADVEVRVDPGTPLIAGAAPLPVIVDGEALLAFSAQAGENYLLRVTDLTLVDEERIDVDVFAPDGQPVDEWACFGFNGPTCEQELLDLPQTGIYYVVLRVSFAFGAPTFPANVTLVGEPLAGLQPEVPTAIDTTEDWQRIRLTFSASAGDDIALKFENLLTDPSGRPVSFVVRDPTQQIIAATTGSTTATTLTVLGLPATGTYTVVADPDSDTASLVATLTTPVALSVDGATVSAARPAAGEPVVLAFDAEAGDRLGIGVGALAPSGESAPSGELVSITVQDPGGSAIETVTCATDSGSLCELDIGEAPATGAYQVVVDPPATRASVTVSFDQMLALEPYVATSVDLTRPGSNAKLTIPAADAGLFLFLVIEPDLAGAARGPVVYTLYAPDGTILETQTGEDWSIQFFLELPAAGDYVLTIDPAASGRFIVTPSL